MCLSFCDLKILSPKKYRKEGKSNIRIHIFKNPAWLFLVCSGCCNRIPQMGRLKQWAFISHSSREGSPRSGCWWIRFLWGALFQVCRRLPSCCVLTWWGEHLCCVSSYKGTNPIHGFHPRGTSQRPHLLETQRSHGDWGSNMWILEGHKHSVLGRHQCGMYLKCLF